jgi:uncharacterized protein YjiS (DUF1127 family)
MTSLDLKGGTYAGGRGRWAPGQAVSALVAAFQRRLRDRHSRLDLMLRSDAQLEDMGIARVDIGLAVRRGRNLAD